MIGLILILSGWGAFNGGVALAASGEGHHFNDNGQVEMVFETPPESDGTSRVIPGVVWEFDQAAVESAKAAQGNEYRVKIKALTRNPNWTLKDPETGNPLVPADPNSEEIQFSVPVSEIHNKGLLSAVSLTGESVVERFSIILHAPKTHALGVIRVPSKPQTGAPQTARLQPPSPQSPPAPSSEGDSFYNVNRQVELVFQQPLAAEGRSKSIPGFRWDTLHSKLDKIEASDGTHYRVRLKGEFGNALWSLRDPASGQPLAAANPETSEIEFFVPVTSIETKTQLVAVGPTGEKLSEKFSILLHVPAVQPRSLMVAQSQSAAPPQAPQESELPPSPPAASGEEDTPPPPAELEPAAKSTASAPSVSAPKHRSPPSVQIGLGYSMIKLLETRTPDISETGLTAKLGIKQTLKPNAWDIGGNVFYTAFPISISLPGQTIRFLGANLRLTRQLSGRSSPVGIFLSAGGYYSTTFVTGPRKVGYENVAGPQLYPSLSFALSKSLRTALYFKYSPMVSGLEVMSLSNREVATGISLSTQRFSLSLDYANLTLAGPTHSVDITSTTLGLGVNL